jgi:hypothetical protein
LLSRAITSFALLERFGVGIEAIQRIRADVDQQRKRRWGKFAWELGFVILLINGD